MCNFSFFNKKKLVLDQSYITKVLPVFGRKKKAYHFFFNLSPVKFFIFKINKSILNDYYCKIVYFKLKISKKYFIIEKMISFIIFS